MILILTTITEEIISIVIGSLALGGLADGHAKLGLAGAEGSVFSQEGASGGEGVTGRGGGDVGRCGSIGSLEGS